MIRGAPLHLLHRVTGGIHVFLAILAHHQRGLLVVLGRESNVQKESGFQLGRVSMAYRDSRYMLGHSAASGWLFSCREMRIGIGFAAGTLLWPAWWPTG